MTVNKAVVVHELFFLFCSSRRSVSEDCVRAQNIILKIDNVKEAARGIPAITATLNQLSELAKIKNTVASLQGPMAEAFACPVCKGTCLVQNIQFYIPVLGINPFQMGSFFMNTFFLYTLKLCILHIL